MANLQRNLLQKKFVTNLQRNLQRIYFPLLIYNRKKCRRKFATKFATKKIRGKFVTNLATKKIRGKFAMEIGEEKKSMPNLLQILRRKIIRC